MNIVAIFLFVLSSSLDIFTVALAYGFKNIKMNFSSNIVIALISSLGTFLSMELGILFIDIFPPKIIDQLGSIILFCIGIYFFIQYYRSRSNLSSTHYVNDKSPALLLESPEIADINKSGKIEFKESFILSIALSLNNVGLGIGASIAGLNIFFTTITTFIFSILIIPLGFYCSKKLLKRTNLHNKGSLISAIIIILLAIITFL